MNNEIDVNVAENTEQTGFEFSIIELVALAMRNWWILAIVGAVFAIAVYAYTKTTSVPTYTSSGSIYIDTQMEQRTGDVNTSALMGARDLMPTYIEILKSRTFCTQISDAIDNKYAYKEIQKMLKLSQTEGTNIMLIKVNSIDRQDAYTLCNAVIDAAPNEILRVFEGGSVKIIDRPEGSPSMQVSNAYKRGAVGFVLGAVVALVVLFIFNMFDTRIETTDELTNQYNLPILGEVPNLVNLS